MEKEKEPVYYIIYWKVETNLQDTIKSGKGELIKYIGSLIDDGYSFKFKKI